MQKKSFEQRARIITNKLICEPKIAPLMEQLRWHSDKTFVHSMNVAFITVQMGLNRNFKKERLENMARGALLHDIGKLHVDKEILASDKILTGDEYDIIKKHPEEGCNIIKELGFSPIVSDIIRHHHEKNDGSGYPDGLESAEISIEVNLVSVADVWDAMTSERAYKQEYTGDVAEAEIRDYCASYFDHEAIRLLMMCPDK